MNFIIRSYINSTGVVQYLVAAPERHNNKDFGEWSPSIEKAAMFEKWSHAQEVFNHYLMGVVEVLELNEARIKQVLES